MAHVFAADLEVARVEQEEVQAAATDPSDRRGSSWSCAEGTDDPEVLVRWNQATDAEAAELVATLTNSWSDSLEVTVTVLATHRSGKAAERALPPVVVEPGATVPVVVPLGDVPIQSVGSASAVVLRATWQRSAMNGMPGAEVASLSEVSWVTHDESTRRGRIRSEASQRAHEFGRGAERARRLRVFDPARGRVVELASAELAELPTVEVQIGGEPVEEAAQ